MYKINDKLAVHGFDWDWNKMQEISGSNKEYDELNYGVITNPKFDRSGKKLDGKIILDCRTLLDDWVNPKEEYEELINLGCLLLEHHFDVVCCCSAGQSRSNAIALGILIKHFKMNFYDAWELIRAKNPFCNIGMQHFDMIKKIFGVTLP